MFKFRYSVTRFFEPPRKMEIVRKVEGKYSCPHWWYNSLCPLLPWILNEGNPLIVNAGAGNQNQLPGSLSVQVAHNILDVLVWHSITTKLIVISVERVQSHLKFIWLKNKGLLNQWTKFVKQSVLSPLHIYKQWNPSWFFEPSSFRTSRSFEAIFCFPGKKSHRNRNFICPNVETQQHVGRWAEATRVLHGCTLNSKLITWKCNIHWKR